MKLIERLQTAASRWEAENNRSLAHLATKVANDGKTFNRIAAGGSISVELYERFQTFLLDPLNWQAGVVPDDVAALLSNPLPEPTGEAEAA